MYVFNQYKTDSLVYIFNLDLLASGKLFVKIFMCATVYNIIKGLFFSTERNIECQ